MFNILILHDNNKYITANGQMTFNVGTDNIHMSRGDDSFYANKLIF